MLAETRNSQPDILEVIADLSNDEVRTPPKVANAVLDLLPEHVWSDPTLRWLDPGCKTGVFLREITRRLMVGLADQIPDEQERLEHILRNQVYGIAITELTALMSRRTVYCSKAANSEHSTAKLSTESGNIWFDRVEHAYRKGRCAECGASEERFEREGRENHAYALIHASGRHTLRQELDMKFDVIVGNPPYQMEDDGHGSSATTIYQKFVENARDLQPRYIAMITLSRWFSGGKGVDGFRDWMLHSRHIRTLVDYPNAAEVFPGPDIKGGVSYFLWDRDNPGPCEFTSIRQGVVDGPTERSLDEFDVLVRDNRGLSILRKVLAAGEPSLSDQVSARWTFGTELTSNFSDYHEAQAAGDFKLYMQQGARRGDIYVSPSVVTRNVALAKEWKVLLPKAGPGNSGGHG